MRESGWLRLMLLMPPMVEPLTAAEAKTRLNIGDEVPDDVMDAYITASRQCIDGADGWLGRAINTQTWRGTCDAFPTDCGGKVYIPLPPLQSLTVSYLDPVGATVPMIEGVDYYLARAQRPYIIPASNWPSVTSRTDAITIEFVAGYGDDGIDVPEPIRTAIALGAGHLRSMSARNLSITEEVEEGIGSTRYVVSANAGDVINYAVGNLLAGYQVMWV